MLELKFALRVAAIRSVRTFAQTASGGLLGISIAGIAIPELKQVGTAVAVVLLSSAMAALVAFFQNFAESLPEV